MRYRWPDGNVTLRVKRLVDCDTSLIPLGPNAEYLSPDQQYYLSSFGIGQDELERLLEADMTTVQRQVKQAIFMPLPEALPFFRPVARHWVLDRWRSWKRNRAS